MTPYSPPLIKILWRALRKRCPQCGQAKLYQSWYRLKPHCENCQYSFLRDPIDILSFMYISTAGITGAVVLAMFWFSNLADAWWLRASVIVGGLLLMLASLPYRKALAIGLDLWTQKLWGEE